MLKKLMLAVVLAGAGQAGAVTWEYALYTDIKDVGESWVTPTEGVTGKDINEILAGMKCDQKGLIGLMNCAGAQGWEFVQFTEEKGTIEVTRFIFKRPKA